MYGFRWERWSALAGVLFATLFAIALALLGNYSDAVRTGEKAIRVFKVYGDELATGKIENNIGSISIRQENLSKAEKFFLSARKRFLKIQNTEELIVSEIAKWTRTIRQAGIKAE